MSFVCKALGAALSLAGLLLAVWLAIAILRDEEFAKAAMLMERNPGNVLYESKYFVAAVWRAIRAGVAISGALVALNGMTFFLIGVLSERIERLGGTRSA